MPILNPARNFVRLGGDLGSQVPRPQVTGFQARPVSPTAPAVGDFIRWSGTEWAPAIAPSGSFSAGQDLSGTSSAQTVIGLQTNPVSATAPNIGDALVWSGVDWAPAVVTPPTPVTGVSRTYLTIGLPTVGQAVRLVSPNTVDLADATTEVTAPAVGVILSIPAPGQAVVMHYGEVTGFVGLTPDSMYYIGTTPGTITLVAPVVAGQVVQRIGIALSSTELLVMSTLEYVVR